MFRIAAACISRSINMPFYAVGRGKKTGIYSDWGACKAQVDGFSGARYKKFASQTDAQAFINEVKSETKTLDAVPAPSAPLHHVPISDYIPLGLVSKKRTLNSHDKPPPPKRQKKNNNQPSNASTSKNFNTGSLKPGPVEVYTDGACTGNGKDRAKAAIGVYWGPDHVMNISERLPGRQTNNRAEIHAARRAIEQAKTIGRHEVRLCTDSQFLINAMTKWVNKWQKNNWKLVSGNPVINKRDFEQLLQAVEGMEIIWIKVAGHAGILGNERADRLANEGLNKPYLFKRHAGDPDFHESDDY